LATIVIGFPVFVIDDVVDTVEYVQLLKENPIRQDVIEDLVRLLQSQLANSCPVDPTQRKILEKEIEAAFPEGIAQKLKDGTAFMLLATAPHPTC